VPAIARVNCANLTGGLRQAPAPALLQSSLPVHLAGREFSFRLRPQENTA